MIYENDIPDMPDNTIHADEIVAKQLYITPQGIRRRWKPNGITNNIEQYESKAGLKGETRLKKRMWKHALSKAVYNYCKNIHHDKSTPQNREKKRNTYIQRR